MATLSGRYAKVTLGSTTVVGLGNWNMEGVSQDQIDTTAFGSVWKTYAAGMSDGGQITFNGYYDSTDTNGQEILISANRNATLMSNHTYGLRFYIDNTSYYCVCTTSPAAGSYIIVTNYSITHDKSDVARVNFTAKVSGAMTLTA
jgi:hypothetical protein